MRVRNSDTFRLGERPPRRTERVVRDPDDGTLERTRLRLSRTSAGRGIRREKRRMRAQSITSTRAVMSRAEKASASARTGTAAMASRIASMRATGCAASIRSREVAWMTTNWGSRSVLAIYSACTTARAAASGRTPTAAVWAKAKRASVMAARTSSASTHPAASASVTASTRPSGRPRRCAPARCRRESGRGSVWGRLGCLAGVRLRLVSADPPDIGAAVPEREPRRAQPRPSFFGRKLSHSASVSPSRKLKLPAPLSQRPPSIVTQAPLM